jgi:hypothetical protein
VNRYVRMDRAIEEDVVNVEDMNLALASRIASNPICGS